MEEGYKYYVVYEIYTGEVVVGRGSGEVLFKKRIDCEGDIREIERCIIEDVNKEEGDVLVTGAVILNYILMEEY